MKIAFKHNKRRSDKLFKRKIKSKAKKKTLNRFYASISADNRSIHRRHKFQIEKQEFTTVLAPDNFSFVNNTLEIVQFIDTLSKLFDQRKRVFIDMKNVSNLSFDALVVLLSIMVNFKTHRIGFNGNFPKSKAAKDLLLESGFFHYLYKELNLKDRYNLNEKNRIHTHAWKDVDSPLGAKIIGEASETIWGEPKRCQGVQRAFLELMQNTNNHASKEKEGEKHWWLSVTHVVEERKVAFSFVDFGIGIFASLNNKTSKSKFFNWAEKLKKAFTFRDNADLLKLILDGELHKTVTNKHFRGKGLPGLQTLMKRNQISNLYIVTNDVKADVKNDSYKTLNGNFNGTFVYWELNYSNQYCDD